VSAAAAFPYRRLASLYGLYFAILGAFIPYWSVYLKAQGYTSAEIGQLMAVVMGTKILAPNLWAWLVNHTGRSIGLMRLATAMAAMIFAGIFAVTGYWPLAAIMAGYSFFWHAVLPQFEVLTLNHLGPQQVHRYSRIRLWGSIGFIIAVAGIGGLLDQVDVGWLPPLVFGLLAALALMTWSMPAAPSMPHPHGDSGLGQALRNPAAIALLLSCLLMQASHGPYYTFFTIFLEDTGYPRGIVGTLWALGVLAEIGVFLLVHRWLTRFGAERLLLWSMLITAARWLLIAGGAAWPAVLIAAQLMHAASYGLFHAAAIHLLHRLFPGRAHTPGQALYSSLSFGLGGALGSLVSGQLWDSWGGAATFALAGLVAAAAGAVVARWLVPRSAATQQT